MRRNLFHQCNIEAIQLRCGELQTRLCRSNQIDGEAIHQAHRMFVLVTTFCLEIQHSRSLSVEHWAQFQVTCYTTSTPKALGKTTNPILWRGDDCSLLLQLLSNSTQIENVRITQTHAELGTITEWHNCSPRQYSTTMRTSEPLSQSLTAEIPCSTQTQRCPVSCTSSYTSNICLS